MNIVVLDGQTLNPGDNAWDPIARLGTLKVHDRTARDEVVARAAEADVVITNKTLLRSEALECLDRLRLISVLATGYDNVDLAAARTRGVTVCNVPAYATDSVAQHTVALLLELCQRVGAHDAAVHGGEWQRAREFCFWLSAPVELSGLVMGIVGLGRIGRRTAELAHAFGMTVIAATRGGRPPSSVPPFVALVPIEELFTRSDIVSLHCPLTAESEQLVDARMLARMKPAAFLVNTARGRLVDENALAAALSEGRLAGAALDTVSREPIADDHPLLAAPNCIITPHMAWASLAARRRLMLATADNIRAFLAGRPINVVS